MQSSAIAFLDEAEPDTAARDVKMFTVVSKTKKQGAVASKLSARVGGEAGGEAMSKVEQWNIQEQRAGEAKFDHRLKDPFYDKAFRIQQNVADELSLTETDDDGQSEEDPFDMDSAYVAKVEDDDGGPRKKKAGAGAGQMWNKAAKKVGAK